MFAPEGDRTLTGARTLVKRPNGSSANARGALAFPLLMAAIVFITSWVIGAGRSRTPQHPADYANPEVAATAPADQDALKLVIHVPAKHWVDTGIDMCGCAHLHITARGSWEPPVGGRSGASGDIYADRDASPLPLTLVGPYGALVAKVGRDPYVMVGNSRHLDGDQFNDSGTLKLGMNARGHRAGSGQLTVFITGQGSEDHSPSLCETPRPSS